MFYCQKDSCFPVLQLCVLPPSEALCFSSCLFKAGPSDWSAQTCLSQPRLQYQSSCATLILTWQTRSINYEQNMAVVAQGPSQRLVIWRSLVWFPWSACWSVLGQDTEPQTAPDVLVGTLHVSHHLQCINYCKSLRIKVSAKYPKHKHGECDVTK